MLKLLADESYEQYQIVKASSNLVIPIYEMPHIPSVTLKIVLGKLDGMESICKPVGENAFEIDLYPSADPDITSFLTLHEMFHSIERIVIGSSKRSFDTHTYADLFAEYVLFGDVFRQRLNEQRLKTDYSLFRDLFRKEFYEKDIEQVKKAVRYHKEKIEEMIRKTTDSALKRCYIRNLAPWKRRDYKPYAPAVIRIARGDTHF